MVVVVVMEQEQPALDIAYTILRQVLKTGVTICNNKIAVSKL